MTQKYAMSGARDFAGHDQEIRTLTNAREGIVRRCLDEYDHVYQFLTKSYT